MQYCGFVSVLVGLGLSGCTLLFESGQGPLDRVGSGPDASTASESPSDTEERELKRVFITSDSFGGAFDRVGDPRAAANLKCNSAAEYAGLVGLYAAWLSHEEDGAINHIHGSGPWALVGNSELVFESHDDLAKKPDTAINRNEFGHELSRSNVWTGTLVDGTAADELPCQDWAADYYDCAEGQCYYEATVGRSDSKDEDWTDSETIACSELARLYCFEVDRL